MMSATLRPFLPTDPGAKHLRPADHLIRAAKVVLEARISGGDALSILRKMYPDDRGTLAVLAKSAVAPATTSTAGWADTLAATAVEDFVASLAPISAASRLIQAGARADLSGLKAVSYPRRAGAPASTLPWVAEGGAIPVQNRALELVQVGPPNKLAVITTLTRELAELANGEEVLMQLMREDAASSLDASMFSTAAATSSRPAGLLHGLTAITAATGGGMGARLADLENLAAPLAAAGALGVVFVAAPRQAFALSMFNGMDSNITVWPSAALANGMVVAIDPLAFVSGFDAEPSFDITKGGTLHFEDTAPAAIGTAGSPNVLAAPTRSMWQADLIGIRMILQAAWAMRAPNAVSYLTDATWG